MKRQRLASSHSVNRMFQATDEAWNRKDFKAALETAERIVRLDPANPRALLHAGQLHALRYNPAAAEQFFERAFRVAPNKADAMAQAADRFRAAARYDLAERYFQRALEQRDISPDACVKAAEFYERVRRGEAAARLVERALQINGAFAPALLARARLDRQAGRLEDAEKQIRLFLPLTDPDTKVRGLYELGAILDRQGRYDEAMTAFKEAKSVLGLNAVTQVEQHRVMRERLNEACECLTREMLERWFHDGRNLQPPRRLALLGGHPRSGTTLLEQVLDSHPDILSVEETDIFHDEAYLPLTAGFPEPRMVPVLELAPTAALLQSRAAYFRVVETYLGKPIAGRLLVDKNPSLTDLAPLLVRIFPEIKLVVALRDPRDVCLSCFMQAFVPVGPTTSAFLSLQRTTAEYAAMMRVWTKLATFMPNAWLQVRYEDMVRDLESVSRRVLEFLGVGWDERVLRFNEHARQKAVRSPTYADVTKPIFKTAVGRWRNYQKYLEPHLPALEPFVKAFGYE